jgi:hypothetical protein
MPDNQFARLFLSELECVLDGLKSKKLSVVPLSELIGQPVMEAMDAHRASI